MSHLHAQLDIKWVKLFDTIIETAFRLRTGASAPSFTPCPPRISTFEKAVRVFIENLTEDGSWLVIWWW